VQLPYSLATRAAENRLLPLAAARGVAVIVNRPLEAGGIFGRLRGWALPEWAAEFDCASWAQLFLKYVLAEPAVTSAIPATADPEHLQDNLMAGIGHMPDARQRQRVRDFWDAL
jgi:aryl-alcohol dehydrogenase-like predicted oxidoreductase